MLFLIQVTMFLFIASGCYLIITSQMQLATHKSMKAAKAFNRNNKNLVESDVFLTTIAAFLANYIKMDPYKRKRLEADLKCLNITTSPELYRATALIKSGMVLLGVIPCLILFPVASVGFMAASIILYFKSESDIREQLRKKKDEIEFELPRFVSTLKQELMSSRDVLAILDNYKKNAGDSMKQELDITVADMRSGNYEAALLRFEGRLSIPALSDIIRGLIGVLRGDNNVHYFEMLSHDLDVLEVQRLENLAMKQPGKIKKYLFLLLMCLIIMYITILGVYTITSIM